MDALFGAILAGGLFCLLGWGFVKLTRGVESLINKKRNETNNEKPPENKISNENHEGYINEIKETNVEKKKESVYCNGLTVKEKESSDKFRKVLLIFNEIAITGNSTILKPEEVEKKLISFATEFPEIIYVHACDRLKRYNSISSQDRTELMYSLRDIIGEDMERNVMNARNEKQIDEYFEELIDSTVKMIRKL